jgi:ATP-dependent protease ClpP protease subunit
MSKFSEEWLEALSNKPEPFQVSGTANNMTYKVSIDEDFESVRQFEDIVTVLDAASEGDFMDIKLSTNGGALHAILPLLNSMRRTKAIVGVHAVSDVASAGTFLLMAADEVYVNPYITLMFHQVSFGSGGAGSSVESHVAHTLKASKAIIHEMYKDFFTEHEISAMLSGKDFYMGKDEFDKRYDKREEARKELVASIIEEMAGEEEALDSIKPVENNPTDNNSIAKKPVRRKKKTDLH